jgi:pimeloyl-ACP methyl ester carboxylesterase
MRGTDGDQTTSVWWILRGGIRSEARGSLRFRLFCYSEPVISHRLLVALALTASVTLAAVATLDGIRVYYESLGNGKRAVVFIHGWTCDHTFWRLNAPAIARKHRVLLVDLPGHGESGKPEIDYTMSLFARAVERVMRQAGVEQAVLVGHSMGVPVVRQFLREFPAKAVGTVMVDGAIWRPPIDLTKVIDEIRTGGVEARSKRIDGMFVDRTAPALRKEIREKMLGTPQHVAASAGVGIADPATHKLDPIHVPTLFIVARSQSTSADQEQFLRSVISQLDYEPWDGAGHFLMMEQPERFNRSVLEFIEKRLRW